MIKDNMNTTTMQDEDFMVAMGREAVVMERAGRGNGSQELMNMHGLVHSFRTNHQAATNVHRFNGFSVGQEVTILNHEDLNDEAANYIHRSGILCLFNQRSAWVRFGSRGDGELIRIPWAAVHQRIVIADAGFDHEQNDPHLYQPC